MKGKKRVSIELKTGSFDPKTQVRIVWSTDNVHIIRPDLTEKQRLELLLEAAQFYDSISWSIIKQYAEKLFGKMTVAGCKDCKHASDIIDDHGNTLVHCAIGDPIDDGCCNLYKEGNKI